MVPEFVARPGGSKWQSALPTGSSNRVSAPPTGSAGWKSAGKPADSENSGTLIYGSRIRRSARRQQVAVGSADQAQPAFFMKAAYALTASYRSALLMISQGACMDSTATPLSMTFMPYSAQM